MLSHKLLAGAALGLLLAAGPAAADTLLSSGTFGGRAYFVYQAAPTITWDAAELAAVSLGGHLASINSLEESDYVYGLVEPHKAALYGGDGFNLLGPWLGGRRTADTGFGWSDGSAFGFTHFAGGEPNNINGHEFNIQLFSSGGDPIDEAGEGSFWNDLSGDNTTIKGYVVERAAPSGAPEPAAWALMLLGFGAMGLALRRRRPSALRAAGLAVAAMALTAAPALASERVVNGDFSAGLTGFTSDYTVYPPGPVDEPHGNIFLTTNPASICGCLAGMGDHTTGSGNMIVLDGAADPDVVFWRQTLSVAAHTDYALSFWAANLGGGPAPNLSARIDGVQLLATGALNGGWNPFGGTFNSGGATSLTLSFVDTTNTHSFNDFAFDDVSVTGAAPGGVPEPAGWALMILGFAAAGGALRRRMPSPSGEGQAA